MWAEPMRSELIYKGESPGMKYRPLSFQTSQREARYSHLIAHAIRGVTPYESVAVPCWTSLSQWFTDESTVSVRRIGSHPVEIFSFCSPILVQMFHAPSGLYPFVVACKECRRNIPAPVETLPDSWIIAKCPLCEEQRRYLPTDIFQGRLSHELIGKFRRAGDVKWAR